MKENSPPGRSLAEIVPTSLTQYRLHLVREPDPRFASRSKATVEDLASLAHSILRGFDREAVGAIYLDIADRAIGYTVAYIGTLRRTAVEPRGLLVPGLLANASRLVAFHNHPSGTANPSGDDILFTRRLAEAGDLVGLEVVDHLILGEEPRFISLRSRGLL